MRPPDSSTERASCANWRGAAVIVPSMSRPMQRDASDVLRSSWQRRDGFIERPVVS